MNKLLLSLVVILLLSGGISAQNWAWKNFSPPSKAWSILAPGTMLPDQEAQEAGSKVGSYAYSDFYGYFAVVYRDSNLGFWSLRPDYSSYYEKVRNDFIKTNKGQLLSETKFIKGKSIGRDVEIKIPVGQITGLEGNSITKYRIERIRMFFVGKRFYLLLAVLPEDIIDTAAVDNYFSSFTTNSAPDVVADSYSTDEDTFLTINGASGVLVNDSDEQDDKITVAPESLTTQTAHGILKLNADGSFIYSPEANFNGQDSFTYKATDGQLDSIPVTVTIKVNPVNDAPTLGELSSNSTLDELTALTLTATANDVDNPVNSLRFSLSDAPAGAAIDPVSGIFRWTPTEAQGPGNYAFRVNVSDGSLTASKTVNVTTNEVNVAPRLSNVPPSANINELSAYSFIAAATDVDIPVQTLTFSLIDAPAGASINPSNGVFSWTPTEAQGNNSTYNFTVRVSDGVVNTDLPVKLTALEVNSAPILPEIAAQNIDELKVLSLTANGSDTDIPANTLTYSLGEGAPVGMTINSATGAISWTPTEAQGAGDYLTTIRVTDNGSPGLSATRTFKVHVNEVNLAPELPAVDNKIVDEETPLTFAVRAADADLPANNLTYTLKNAPNGASINSTTGAFSWIPSEAQGAGDYPITIVVNDNGSPNLSATRTFNVHVNEINVAPKFNVIGNKTVDEETPLTFTVEASDADLPKNTLTFSLQNAPSGAMINASTGVFIWTPSEVQGAGDYAITVVVTDNGSPNLSASQTFNVHVNEVNVAPKLTVIGNKTVDEETLLSFTAAAADADLPANSLTFSLENAPAGAAINPVTGEFKWTPTEAQGAGDYKITIRVTDNGSPNLSATQTINVHVNEVNVAPKFNSITDKTVNEETLLSFTANAADTDLPVNALTYTLTKAPTGAKVDPATGAFSWTPNEAQGAGDYPVTIRVTDNGSPNLSAAQTFNVHVNEVNLAPQISPISDKTVDEATLLTFTASATDADLPANSLVYSLKNAPAGAVINPATGNFSWTPNEAQGAGDYSMTIVVTDNGSLNLSAAQTFKVHVNEINVAPKFNATGNKTIDEETSLTFTVGAADADLPANALTYSLKNAPTGASFNPTTGEFKWTPDEAQGPGNYTVTFGVTDNGTPSLSAEETVTITVREVNTPPTADNAQLNTNEDTVLSFILKAGDLDLPPNNLTFSIVTAPVNGTLSGTAPNLTYTPKPDFNGADSLVFKVNDGKTDSKTATVLIKIAPVNDAPKANSDAAATLENTPVIINVTANDTDIDGDKIVLSDVSEAVGGTVEIVNGQVKFTPNQNFRGSGGFKYKISDGSGGIAVGSVTVTVNPSNKVN